MKDLKVLTCSTLDYLMTQVLYDADDGDVDGDSNGDDNGDYGDCDDNGSSGDDDDWW